MKYHPLLYASAGFLTVVLISACTSTKKPPLKTVAKVDLPKYMGDWRVIANIPYFAERGCMDSIESYALRPDGLIANTFSYRKPNLNSPRKEMNFTAEVHNHQTNAEWRLRVLPPFIKAKYFVVDLDEKDYQWAVIGHPSRNYGWILARQKTMPDELYSDILHRLQKQGYDPAKFEKVRHRK